MFLYAFLGSSIPSSLASSWLGSASGGFFLELEPENPAADQLILKAERAGRLALATAKMASQRMLAA